MEAMAARLPVISSQVAGVGELVQDRVSGFTIPAGDLESLVERLDTVMSDPERATQMGQAGRNKVSTEFAIKTEMNWLAQLYQASLQNTPLPNDLRDAPNTTKSSSND